MTLDKKIDETRHYLLYELKHNDLTISGVPLGTMSPAVGLNICAITAGIEKYKSIIKKQNKKHDKNLLTKTKLSKF